MDISTLLYGLGASSLFASRAFLPAFLTACIIRWGDQIPLLGSIGIAQPTGSEPVWFSSDIVIGTLGVLALIELLAEKVPEAKELLSTLTSAAKPIMAALATLGVASAQDIDFVNEAIVAAGMLDFVSAGVVAFLCQGLTGIRNQLMNGLSQMDPSDEIGIQALISWLEDSWVIVGFIMVVVLPIFALIIIGIVFGFFALIARHFRKKEKLSKVSCSNCQHEYFGSALKCPKCLTENPNPSDIGFFGGTKKTPVYDKEDHKFKLIEKKRCPVCATHFEKRSIHQECSSCGHQLFSDRAFAEAYLNRIGSRLAYVLPVTFIFSLLPFLGLVLGIIYYRIKLTAPLSLYIPLHKNFLVRWLLRILFFMIMVIQIIPGIGGFAVPLMALISYKSYRRAFASSLKG